jgi:isopentenyl diphosphate isomerase/L-lactate dehydrogenase-like FMN-dependent dehydrogenase
MKQLQLKLLAKTKRKISCRELRNSNKGANLSSKKISLQKKPEVDRHKKLLKRKLRRLKRLQTVPVIIAKDGNAITGAKGQEICLKTALCCAIVLE